MNVNQASCSNGQVECYSSSKTLCEGSCTDLRTAPDNCGACGHACPGQFGCGYVDNIDDLLYVPGTCAQRIQVNVHASGMTCNSICQQHGAQCFDTGNTWAEYHKDGCSSGYSYPACDEVIKATISAPGLCGGEAQFLFVCCACHL